MKTSAQIQFDFAQARRRAEELEEIAAELNRLARNDMEAVMGEVSAAWRGDSASLYLSKADRLQQEITGSSRDLNSIAASIRTIARRMYEAEMEALRIATQRENTGGGGATR